MIPLRDLNPAGTVPVVTIGIIALNAVVYLLTMSDLDGAAREFGAVAFHYTGREPLPLFVGGRWIAPVADDGHRIFRAVAHMWLHGGLMHILGNMWFLWVFGDNVEDRLGRGRYLFLYLLSGFVALAAQVISSPDYSQPMIGASGAVSGVLGAYLVLHPKAQVLALVPIGWFITTMVWPAFVFLGIWFGLQILQGVLTPAGAGGVAWWAHTAGFVLGIALGRVLARPEPKTIRLDVARWR